MTTDNPNNFDNYNNDVWIYGIEKWCNMEGRYMFIVADLSQIKDNLPKYKMSLCALGIMGTKYVRDTSPEQSYEITQGEKAEIEIENIYSEIPIGTTLDINMRLNSTNLDSFVSFVET